MNTTTGLTPEQMYTLIAAHVDLVVEKMDVADLEEYVTEDMTNNLEKCTHWEVLEEINAYHPDIFEKLGFTNPFQSPN